MRQLLEGVHTWSVWNAEKQLDFNGTVLDTGEGLLLVDPPPLPDWDAVAALGRVVLIVVTNRDHLRAAADTREALGAPLGAHPLDAALLGCPVDVLLEDGQALPGGLRVIHLPDLKSPGEIALFWPGRRLLLVGDAIISRPTGLGLVPPAKLADPAAARRSLAARLGPLEPEVLLVGDGAPLLEGAAGPLREFLAGTA